MPEPTSRRPVPPPDVGVPPSAQHLRRLMFDQAVDALTRVGRTTWTATRPDGGRGERGFDWARFVTDVVTAAAATLGSTDDALVDSRHGTPEYDRVRDLIAAAAGADDERLHEHLPEPVVIDIPVDALLDQAGVVAAYTDADAELIVAYEALHDTPLLEPERERRLAELDDLAERLTQQRIDDWADYGQALSVHLEQSPLARRLRDQVRFQVAYSGYCAPPPSPYRDIADQLAQQALLATPPPGDGRSPLERLRHPSGTGPAAATPRPSQQPAVPASPPLRAGRPATTAQGPRR
jgi:hypothetical protein